MHVTRRPETERKDSETYARHKGKLDRPKGVRLIIRVLFIPEAKRSFILT